MSKRIEITKDMFERVELDMSQQEKITRPSLTFWQDARQRLAKNNSARIAAAILVLLVFFALFGPLMNPYKYDEQINPLSSHTKLPPRMVGWEKLGILDGSRIVVVGPNALARYDEGEYKILKEFTEISEDSGEEITKYRIKEYTYVMKDVPNEYYWFGTDELARDNWTRVWTGAQISLFIGFVAAIIDLIFGVSYGAIAGYFGGTVDMVMMRIIEIISGIPALVIIILFILFMEPGIMPITIAIAITGWIGMARIVRSQFMKLKGQEFILASRTIGASDLRMILRHFIPNIMGQMIIMITFSIPGAIFYEAFLAFIGLGVPPPFASLGVLINDGYKLMKTAPHLMLIPSVVLSTLMLALNLFANGLRDALDPKMRNL